MIDTDITIDIETIPTQDERLVAALTSKLNTEIATEINSIKAPGNYKDPEKIAAFVNEQREKIMASAEAQWDETYRATSFDGGFGQLAVIGLAFGDNDPIAIFDSHWDQPGYEEHLLMEMGELFLAHNCYSNRMVRLIGHNVLGFDRRFIRQRSIVKRVKVPGIFTAQVKPWETHLVTDTMTLWTGDPRERVKLDKLCTIFGIDGKDKDLGEPIDGSLVWSFVKAGRISDVATYCKGDVRRARAVCQRMEG